jgi:hypothetical protein
MRSAFQCLTFALNMPFSFRSFQPAGREKKQSFAHHVSPCVRRRVEFDLVFCRLCVPIAPKPNWRDCLLSLGPLLVEGSARYDLHTTPCLPSTSLFWPGFNNQHRHGAISPCLELTITGSRLRALEAFRPLKLLMSSLVVRIQQHGHT